MAELSAEELRAMPREAFRTVIAHLLRKEESIQAALRDVRISGITDDLSRLTAEDKEEGLRRMRCPGAPCLQYVDSKCHVRLLAMARLGIFTVEV